MIRFACPHCDKQYTVEDKLAGRHGWCALCMGLLTVPSADDPAHSHKPTPEEKLKSLRALLHAAEDRFKAHQERFQKTDQLARALYKKHKALEVDMNERGERIASQTGRLEEALAQTKRLTRALAVTAKARGEAEALLARAQEDYSQLQGELEAERQARILAEEGNRANREALPTREPDERHAVLEAQVTRMSGELEVERTARVEAERDCRAAEVRLAGLEGQLRHANEELERLRQEVARGQALEGQLDRLERDRAALRESYEHSVQALGVAEGRAQQALAELERQQHLIATMGTPVPARAAEEPNGELERLREELREERAARLEVVKSEREQELLAAQALREAEQQRARTAAVELAVAEAERAMMDATARAERLTGELETARAEREHLRKEAKISAELESGLNVSLARAEELQQTIILLTSEVGLAARAAGAAEARIEELSRELERVAGDLEQERSLRREADERARELSDGLRETESRLADALRRAEEAEDRAARKQAFAPPPREQVDAVQVTLVPELMDVPETDDLMMETLLRFIEPE